jgi:hypothetical protein
VIPPYEEKDVNYYRGLMAGVALAFAVSFAVPVDAQWGGGQGERPSAEQMEKRRQEERAKLYATLKLDEAQTKLVDALLTAADTQRQGLMEEMRASFGDRETMREIREDMQDLQKDLDEKITKVLTEEQGKLYAAYRREQAQNRGRWRRRANDDGDDDGEEHDDDGEEHDHDGEEHDHDGEEHDHDGEEHDDDGVE